MILKTAQVRMYKCIMDSGVVDIENGVTCLVGKNESGKTAFLEALYLLNPTSPSKRDKFQELYHYPRKRRNLDKSIISESIPIEAVFLLEEQDINLLETKYGTGCLKSKEIKVMKTYSNSLIVKFDVDEKAVIKFLVTKNGLDLSAEANESNTIKELITEIEKAEERPEAIEEFLKHIKSLNLINDIEKLIAEQIPKFLYFDHYSVLPGRFSIPYIQSTSPSQLNSDEKTALALLKLAGVDTKEFIEDEYEARKAALEAAAVQISDEVFEFWSQNQNLRVDFDIDFKSPAKDNKQPPYLDIRIWNDRHRMSLNFNERSTGFVWFFSFLTYFSEFRNSQQKLIILLDEPGLSLHASAQADLLRFIDERLIPSHQILYTTHSPFMVKANELQRARTVEDIKDIGTKISSDILTTNRDTVFPLQAALGYELAQTLFVGPTNLVVEGPSDILYLQIISDYLKEQGRTSLDFTRWTLVPAGGADKIPTFIALLGSQLDITVLMDVASGQNQRIESMVKRGILASKRLIPLSDITGKKESDIEDLFSIDFYLELLSGCKEAKLQVDKLKPGIRIIKRIEMTIGHEFDHYRPAYYLLKNQDSLLSKLDSSTLERFEELFRRINKTLK